MPVGRMPILELMTLTRPRLPALDTLRDGYYHDPYLNANIPALLYCFQFIFPLIIAVLILVCVGCSHLTLRDYAQNHADDDNSRATISAYAFICVVFVLYVLALDVVACVYSHQKNTEYSTTYDQSLKDYPGTVFFYDIFALPFWVITFIVVLRSTTAQITEPKEKHFLFLTLAGVAPLLCLTSHSHYILIAWLTHPLYASRIGIYYGITIFVHFFLLKQTYKQVSKIVNRKAFNVQGGREGENRGRVKPVVSMIDVSSLLLAPRPCLLVFVVMIPISYSIQDTPNTVYTIIQGISVLLLSLVAYKVILDPNSSFSVGGGLQIALTRLKSRKDSTTGLYTRDWKNLNDEQKLADVFVYNTPARN